MQLVQELYFAKKYIDYFYYIKFTIFLFKDKFKKNALRFLYVIFQVSKMTSFVIIHTHTQNMFKRHGIK